MSVKCQILVQISMSPNHYVFPLKDGMELCRGTLTVTQSPHLEQNPKVTFDVAFGESEILKGESLIPTFKRLLDVFNATIDIFRPSLIVS